MDGTNDLSVICCFCGEPLERRESVWISLTAGDTNEETQSLYAHKACLKRSLHRSIPLHPDLDPK